MSVSQQWQLFKILAAILHLGNISITTISKRSTDSDIKTEDEALQHTMTLLGLKSADFIKWICKRKIQTSNESVITPRDPKEATQSRDALAKFIYSQLFDWYVLIILFF